MRTYGDLLSDLWGSSWWSIRPTQMAMIGDSHSARALVRTARSKAKTNRSRYIRQTYVGIRYRVVEKILAGHDKTLYIGTRWEILTAIEHNCLRIAKRSSQVRSKQCLIIHSIKFRNVQNNCQLTPTLPVNPDERVDGHYPRPETHQDLTSVNQMTRNSQCKKTNPGVHIVHI